jgi:hypothetical protein
MNFYFVASSFTITKTYLTAPYSIYFTVKLEANFRSILDRLHLYTFSSPYAFTHGKLVLPWPKQRWSWLPQWR